MGVYLDQCVFPPQTVILVPLSSDILSPAVHLPSEPLPVVVVAILINYRPLSVCLAIFEVSLVDRLSKDLQHAVSIHGPIQPLAFVEDTLLDLYHVSLCSFHLHGVITKQCFFKGSGLNTEGRLVSRYIAQNYFAELGARSDFTKEL